MSLFPRSKSNAPWFLKGLPENDQESMGKLFGSQGQHDIPTDEAPMTMPQNMPDMAPEPHDYSYDLQAPTAHKDKLWQTGLRIALPALLSGLNKTGAVQGAILGGMGVMDRRDQQDQAGVAAYDKERNFRQKDRSIDSTNDYKSQMLELGKEKNRIAANKPEKMLESEKLAGAQSRIARAKAMGTIPDDQDLALVQTLSYKYGLSP